MFPLNLIAFLNCWNSRWQLTKLSRFWNSWKDLLENRNSCTSTVTTGQNSSLKSSFIPQFYTVVVKVEERDFAFGISRQTGNTREVRDYNVTTVLVQ